MEAHVRAVHAEHEEDGVVDRVCHGTKSWRAKPQVESREGPVQVGLVVLPLDCTSEEPVLEVLGSLLNALRGAGTLRHDRDVTRDGGVGNTGDMNLNRLWFDPECDRCGNGVKDIAGAATVLGVDLDLEVADVGQVLFGDCEPRAEDAVNARFQGVARELLGMPDEGIGLIPPMSELPAPLAIRRGSTANVGLDTDVAGGWLVDFDFDGARGRDIVPDVIVDFSRHVIDALLDESVTCQLGSKCLAGCAHAQNSTSIARVAAMVLMIERCCGVVGRV